MKIDGNLIIAERNKSEYAALTSVGGWLDVGSECSLPALTSVGALYVSSKCSLPALTSVGGALDVRAKCSLPALTSVVGALYVSSKCSLPALTSVSGRLYVSSECALPALTSVGGRLDVGSKCDTPYGRLLALSGYGLFYVYSTRTYHAGCRQGLTSEQALAHWNRDDERAKIFTAAIIENERLTK